VTLIGTIQKLPEIQYISVRKVIVADDGEPEHAGL
jgi:hypothetical protein